jgi:multisubunit Na+/H+ antiporter MnhB subunit
MIGVSTLLTIMRRILQTVALFLGSLGIMALWGSFYWPDCGIDALLMLTTATGITLGLPEPQAATPARRAIADPIAPGRRFVARLRRFLAACGIRPRPR